MAISYDGFDVSRGTYKDASVYIKKIVQSLTSEMNIFADCILNINIPYGDIKGYKITKLGIREYDNVIEERKSPYGKRYVWIGGQVRKLDQEKDSDIQAIEEGYISITPINIDMTNYKKIDVLNNINLL
ncbi:5'/3'-nucleotidase SurE [Paraclostridium benzoelyticum]